MPSRGPRGCRPRTCGARRCSRGICRRWPPPRSPRDSTGVPGVGEACGELPVEAVVLDGEAIALRDDGRPHPFQVTMSRFGSRVAVADVRRSVPLSCFFFDCLHVDGEDLIDRPARERLAALDDRLPASLRVPRIETDDAEVARRF